jgi:intracellular sulfur oxidation DsrE/DsrF family protein
VSSSHIGRRNALKAFVSMALGSVGAAAAAACGSSPSAAATSPGTAAKLAYDRAIATDGVGRAAFQNPHLSNAGFCLYQANQWLNAMVNAYHLNPADVRLVIVNYATANYLTYNDDIWQTYKIGQLQRIMDPKTGEPATRNVYADDVRRLQERHVVFYTCSQALMNHSGDLVALGHAPGETVEQVADRIRRNLVEGAFLVPAGVGELSRVQLSGHPIIYIPKTL